MVGEEIGIYGIFIEMNTKSYVTLLLSMHEVDNLGKFNFILLYLLFE